MDSVEREHLERMVRIESKLDEMLVRQEHGDNTLGQRISFLQDRHDDLAIVVGANQADIKNNKELMQQVREAMNQRNSFLTGVSSSTKFVIAALSALLLVLQAIIAINTLGG